MILYIDTSSNERMTIALVRPQGSVLSLRSARSLFQQSKKMLPMIDAQLKRHRAKPASIRGIIVIAGPGSFTSIRIGITTANSLAFALGVPCVGIQSRTDGSTSDNISRGLTALRKKKGVALARPAYGSEPHITWPKAKNIK